MISASATFHGQLTLGATRRADGRTVLSEQAFRAPFHLGKPYWDADTGTLLVQVVNPTAGILSGDQLSSSVRVDSGAAMLLTTPSASRVFCMREGRAVSRQEFTVGADAWLEVLPEPLVPHRGSVFHQTTVLDVATGGSALYADLLYPGRIAHGDAWEWTRLTLQLEVRAGGALVLRERFDQTSQELLALARMAGFGETVMFGNAVFIPAAPDDGAGWRDALHALQTDGVWIGASQLHGGAGWSIKFIAPDGIRLRRTLAAIRSTLAPVAPHLRCDARKL
ncbi:MAG: urease accessory protein UreD [Verrucomicrobiota bacterium]